jgi:hypothetical protein
MGLSRVSLGVEHVEEAGDLVVTFDHGVDAPRAEAVASLSLEDEPVHEVETRRLPGALASVGIQVGPQLDHPTDQPASAVEKSAIDRDRVVRTPAKELHASILPSPGSPTEVSEA